MVTVIIHINITIIQERNDDDDNDDYENNLDIMTIRIYMSLYNA